MAVIQSNFTRVYQGVQNFASKTVDAAKGTAQSAGSFISGTTKKIVAFITPYLSSLKQSIAQNPKYVFGIIAASVVGIVGTLLATKLFCKEKEEDAAVNKGFVKV